jgi:sulfonate transport system permease protein
VVSSPPEVLSRADPTTPVRVGRSWPERRRDRIRRLARWTSPLALLVIWQLASVTGLVPQDKLPPLDMIWRAALEVTQNGQLGDGLLVSLDRMATGLFAGALAGGALGLFAGLVRWGDTTVDPVLQMIRNVPLFALIPVFILWFGIGELPKIVLVSLAAALPIYINVHAGIREADSKLVEVSRVFGFTRWQRLRHVVLPAAVPHTLVGVRLAVAAAWLSLVVAEQINAKAGIGFMIENARSFLRTDIVFVGLLIYAFAGLVMDGVVRTFERWILRWRV